MGTPNLVVWWCCQEKIREQVKAALSLGGWMEVRQSKQDTERVFRPREQSILVPTFYKNHSMSSLFFFLFIILKIDVLRWWKPKTWRIWCHIPVDNIIPYYVIKVTAQLSPPMIVSIYTPANTTYFSYTVINTGHHQFVRWEDDVVFSRLLHCQLTFYSPIPWLWTVFMVPMVI